MADKDRLYLIHRFLERRKLDHHYDEDVEQIFIRGLKEGQLNVFIRVTDAMVWVDRVPLDEGDPEWTGFFQISLADPDLFAKIRRIMLCP